MEPKENSAFKKENFPLVVCFIRGCILPFLGAEDLIL